MVSNCMQWNQLFTSRGLEFASQLWLLSLTEVSILIKAKCVSVCESGLWSFKNYGCSSVGRESGGGGGGFGNQRILKTLCQPFGVPLPRVCWLMTQELRSTLHPPPPPIGGHPTCSIRSISSITAARRLLAFHHPMNEQQTPATDSGLFNQIKLLI